MTSENKTTKSYEEKLAELEKQAKKIAQQKRKLRAKKREEDQKVLINILTSEFNEKDPQKLKQKINELKQSIDPNKQSNDDDKKVEIELLTQENDELNQTLDKIKSIFEYDQTDYDKLITTIGLYNRTIKWTFDKMQEINLPHNDEKSYKQSIVKLIDTYIANKHTN